MFFDPADIVRPNSGNSPSRAASQAWLLSHVPGLGGVTLISGVAWGFSQLLGGPVILFAILIGMSLNPVLYGSRTKTGISFAASRVLNIGVALLGAKIALVDIAALGWQTASLVIIGVSGIILTGLGVGRVLKLRSDAALIASASVAICGASAAMAIAAVLPRHKQTETSTLLTIVGVSALSTAAMALYPLIAIGLGLSDTQAGLFLGATIHNVGQVIGAGFALSEPVGETATIVKLMRVACLVPVVAAVSFLLVRRTVSGEGRDPATHHRRSKRLLPGFLIGFLALMLINSLGILPASVTQGLSSLSQIMLVFAMAGLGLKTSLGDLLRSSGATCALLIIQTGLLLGGVLLAITIWPALAGL